MTLAAGFAYPASLFGLWFWEARPFGVSLVRILFFIGPGLVPLSQTSAQTSDWLRLNPLTGLFESFRDMFLYGRSPDAENLLYPLAWGLVLLAFSCPSIGAISVSSRRSPSDRGERLGVRFLFDRQRRVVTSMSVHVRREGTEVWGLRDVSFSIEPRPRRGAAGASGSGKT